MLAPVLPSPSHTSQKTTKTWILMWIYSGVILPRSVLPKPQPWHPEQMRSQQAEPPCASGQEHSLLSQPRPLTVAPPVPAGEAEAAG